MRSVVYSICLSLCFLILSSSASAQSLDTIKVMSYNLLNYRNNTISGCSNTNNSPTGKETNLNTIISHVLPEILVVNEVGTSDPAATFRLVSGALNQSGRNYYGFSNMQKGQRQNINSSSTGNLIYWDTRVLELQSSQYIEFDPQNRALVRVIDHFRLYYKDPNLSVHGDTIFLNVFAAHLKAGNTTSDRNERGWATDAIMAYLDSNNIDGNNILTGDLNLYRASETAYQNLLSYSVNSLRFFDPINVAGNWSNNSPFAIVHTQSTRTTGGCGAGGGMDDRFDFILASSAIMNGTDSLKYISGTYEAVGQDGLRFNGSVNGSPTNNSAPTNVVNALASLSDHLPVVMDMEVRLPSSTGIYEEVDDLKFSFNNPVEDMLYLKLASKEIARSLQIIDMTGKIIIEKQLLNSQNIVLDCSDLKKGMYFVKVLGNSNTFSLQKLIKI